MSSFPPARRRIVRALTGPLAAVAGLLVWVVAVPLAGIDLTFTDINDTKKEIGPAAVIIFSVGPALLGWLLIAVLERLVPRLATRIWTIVAVVVLVLSLVPLLELGAGAAVMLAVMHIAVGAVIIVAMRATAPQHSERVPAMA